MIKKLTLALMLSGCVSWVIADAPERLISGMGSSLTASTTPAVLVIEQAPKSETVVNGTFADATVWGTNGNWVVDSGVATFSTNNVATTNGSLYQTITPMTTGATYRLKYTATITGPVTITPMLGTAQGATKDATGTYTEDLFLNTTNALYFTCLATDGATCIVDNVSMRIAPDEAHAGIVELSVAPTDLPVYVSFNCDGNTFTNMYAESKAIIVTSNDTKVVVDRTGSDNAICIRRIWYRSAAGTPTLKVNAY